MLLLTVRVPPPTMAFRGGKDTKSSVLWRAQATAFRAGGVAQPGDGSVRVRVEQSFPGVTPAEAHEAWLSYAGERGGGL
jgi:hypothetical protein